MNSWDIKNEKGAEQSAEIVCLFPLGGLLGASCCLLRPVRALEACVSYLKAFKST